MNLHGIDFTSTPTPKKPLTLARCELRGREQDRLTVRELQKLPDFERFEQALREPGPWIAGLDFPFGLPRRFVRRLNWPEDWGAVVGRVAAMDRREWVATITRYRNTRPPGDKEHRRATDVAAGSLSPMKTHGVPLSKMFQEGAPRIAEAPVSVIPCRPRKPEVEDGESSLRRVVEAYPGVAARALIGRRSYKSENRRKQGGERARARQDLVRCLGSEVLRASHGLTVEMSPGLASQLRDDGTGDVLDSVLCAVQAAWAWKRRNEGFGLPAGADAVEGWIVDPVTCLGGRSR